MLQNLYKSWNSHVCLLCDTSGWALYLLADAFPLHSPWMQREAFPPPCGTYPLRPPVCRTVNLGLLEGVLLQEYFVAPFLGVWYNFHVWYPGASRSRRLGALLEESRGVGRRSPFPRRGSRCGFKPVICLGWDIGYLGPRASKSCNG